MMSRNFRVKLTLPPPLSQLVTNLGPLTEIMLQAYKPPPPQEGSDYCLQKQV